MAYYPELKAPQQMQLTTQVFAGYDHNIRGQDGSFYDMRNMSLRHYPLLSTRQPRRTIRNLFAPGGIIAKDALYWVDDGAFYANGEAVTGLELTEGEKQLVSMGAYIVIWPDKKYINTQDLSDFGSLDQTFETAETVTLTVTRQDGEEYDVGSAVHGTVAPEDPDNGQLWVDTSNDIHTLNQYSAATGEWVQIATVYIKIAAPGIGRGFAEFDGVNISGLNYTGDAEGIREQVELLNADNVIQSCDDDYIVIVGILDQIAESAGVVIKRESPDMDFICESNNRLWGCFYGMKDGKPLNEIYASKLGDFKNWRCYMGLSTDSYAVSLGTDGVFTGAVNYQGYPLFFKETCLHRVYGTQPPYQVQTQLCRGVQEGSHKSLAQVGEVLYYKGRTEVLSYDGSLPQSISRALAEERYTQGVAGSYGSLYYLSMIDSFDNSPLMFVYDTSKGAWCVEDGARPMQFAQLDDELFFITENAMMSTSGGNETVSWHMDTATMGYEYPEQKYLSRWLIRAAAQAGEMVEVYFQYDSSGVWEKSGELVGQGMARSFLVPVIPRRCDHMQMRISGTGDFKLFSLSRVLEKGGDPIC